METNAANHTVLARLSMYRISVLCCCLLVILSGCAPLVSNSQPTAFTPTASATPTPTATPALSTDSDIAHALVEKMSLDEKLGQMVIVEFYGSTLNADLTQMIAGDHIGGVLIENGNGNVQTRSQLVTLNQKMQGQATIPLFISTDFEGGPVNELRKITGERPSETAIGQTGNTQTAYNAGLDAAHDLTGLGLNVNFMPIVDVLTNPNNPGLVMRTFGSDPTLVTNMGRAYLEGLTAGGVIGSLKHFPGLGSATIDPHKSLPTMDRSLATLNIEERAFLPLLSPATRAASRHSSRARSTPVHILDCEVSARHEPGRLTKTTLGVSGQCSHASAQQ